MFTIDHLDTMGNIFIGLQNLFDHGSSRDLNIIGDILYNYCNEGADADGKTEDFPAIVMEVGSLYAEAVSNVEEEPIKYKAALQNEDRRDLAMVAARLSINCTNEQVVSLFLALMDAKKRILAEKEEPVAAPQVVAPPAKRKRRKAA